MSHLSFYEEKLLQFSLLPIHHHHHHHHTIVEHKSFVIENFPVGSEMSRWCMYLVSAVWLLWWWLFLTTVCNSINYVLMSIIKISLCSSHIRKKRPKALPPFYPQLVDQSVMAMPNLFVCLTLPTSIIDRMYMILLDR